MKFFDPPKIHSFLLLNYRFELGSVRWSRNKGTKGGFFFFLFPFFLLFASRTRYECLETNKNLGKARIGIRDIWRQSRLYDRSRRKTAIASICRGCYGLEKSIGGPIVCVPRSFPRTRLTGRGRKKLMGQWWVAEIGENKISSLPLPVEKEKPFEKSYVESFPKPGISTLHLLSLLPFPLFLSPKKKKAVETSLKMLVGDYSVEIARHWPRLRILWIQPTDRPTEWNSPLHPNFLYQFLYTRAPLSLSLFPSLFVNFVAPRFANFQWHFNPPRQTHSQFSPFPAANVYSSFNGQTVKSRLSSIYEERDGFLLNPDSRVDSVNRKRFVKYPDTRVHTTSSSSLSVCPSPFNRLIESSLKGPMAKRVAETDPTPISLSSRQTCHQFSPCFPLSRGTRLDAHMQPTSMSSSLLDANLVYRYTIFRPSSFLPSCRFLVVQFGAISGERFLPLGSGRINSFLFSMSISFELKVTKRWNLWSGKKIFSLESNYSSM